MKSTTETRNKIRGVEYGEGAGALQYPDLVRLHPGGQGQV